MTYDEKALIDEFCKRTGMNKKVVEPAIHSCWKYLKGKMSSGKFDTIRVKYLGSFVPMKHRCVKYLNVIEYQHEHGYINETMYENQKRDILEYLKRDDDEIQEEDFD